MARHPLGCDTRAGGPFMHHRRGRLKGAIGESGRWAEWNFQGMAKRLGMPRSHLSVRHGIKCEYSGMQKPVLNGRGKHVNGENRLQYQPRFRLFWKEILCNRPGERGSDQAQA